MKPSEKVEQLQKQQEKKNTGTQPDEIKDTEKGDRMRDIKERVRDKNPKIRNWPARLPKELVRQTVLEAKEKPRNYREKLATNQNP